MSVPESGVQSPTADGQTPTPAPQKKKFLNGWTHELEDLMADWADKAACYRWMHEKTSLIYQSRDRYFNIPVIILSSVTAGANFALNSITGDDKEMQKWAQLGLGGASLVAGIIQTFMNFYAYAKGSEAHRVAGISWGKFNRLLCIEMRLHPDERMDAFNFLKMFRIELDRLIEQSPSIPDLVIKDFNKIFKDNKDVVRPEITGILEHTDVYKDQNTRLKRIAAEAAIALNYKKGVIKQMVLEDLERKTRQVAIDAAREVAADVIKQQKAYSATLSKISRSGSITNQQKQEREKEIEEFRKENEGSVARLRNKFAMENAKSGKFAINSVVKIQEPSKENVIVTIKDNAEVNAGSGAEEQKDINYIDKKMYEEI
jgi:hypothetical protein